MAWIETSAAASAANPLTPVTSRRFGLSYFLRPIPIALAFVSLAGLALFCGFLVFAKSATTVAAAPPTRAEAIVALTGGSSRLPDAIRLLNAGYGRRLFITGVNPQVKDRDIARITPATSTMIDCCIDLDYRALNTHGNALETRRWVREHGFSSIVVVTSSYHMPRTLLELQRVLPHITFVPYPVRAEVIAASSWWKDPTSLKILAFEYAKYLLAAAHLRFDTAIAAPSRTARVS
ncbi:MAG: YdcF family protein [Alphaproteobacteria bacterium]